MLKKFSVKNFKNFKDEITIDFGAVAGYQFSMDCITNDLISKMLIYGRNATGKTNLGEAITDIRQILSARLHVRNNGVFLNADSSDDSACFSYTFIFNDTEVIYQYERLSNLELKSEVLTVDGNDIFACDYLKEEYHFDNLKAIQAETANTEIYLQSLTENQDAEERTEPRLPFLRWLVSNVAFDNESIMIRLANYVRRITMVKGANGWYPPSFYSYFYDYFENPDNLNRLENFLNDMGIECRLTWRKLPDGNGQLYFAHDKLVPFYENASSGTLSLFDLYCRIFSRFSFEPSLIFMDEFDAFYHYEMSENVVKYIKKNYPRCQVIMTSHNTNLITNQLMRPDCMFILSRRGTLTALCNATERELREGHNLEKMYISGEFEKYE